MRCLLRKEITGKSTWTRNRIGLDGVDEREGRRKARGGGLVES